MQVDVAGAVAAVLKDLVADVVVVADVVRSLSDAVSAAAVRSEDEGNGGASVAGTDGVFPHAGNRFTVGGVPVEVLAPEQAKRHILVRNSTARIDHVKELNTRWALSGPPSVTMAGTSRRPRSTKKQTKTTTFKKSLSADAPPVDTTKWTEPKPVPSDYTRHIAKQKRRARAEKLVQSQQRNGLLSLPCIALPPLLTEPL